MDNQYLSETTFSDLALDQKILESLASAGFLNCSKIQALVLPETLAGHDVTGQAQTGTGKTGAFLIAAFQKLLQEPKPLAPGMVRCLVLAPTRELAIQIAKDAEALGIKTGLKTALVYGGAAYEKQRQQFEKGVDILVGTPGRTIDYFKQKNFNLKSVQVMVLDEADRMFDMGFISDVRFILRRMPLPTKRLNMLFSATLSQKVLELAYEHMNNPVPLKVEAQTVSADNIKAQVYFPANQEKISLLVGLIRKLEPFRAITFVNTKHHAETVQDYLIANNINAMLVSGDVRQNKRERLIQAFADGKFQVMIATDVAARGLHISDVTHVFNYDLPQVAEDYVHRIGRTARAGASGEAHSFACEDTAFYLPEIEAYLGKSIPVQSIDPEWLVDLQRPKRRPPKQKRGGPPNKKHRAKRPGGNASNSSNQRTNKPHNNHS